MKKQEKEKFPYDSFPYRLEHQEGKTKKICYFECEEHLNKYISRYKLKKKEYKSDYKYDGPE
jgi:hypothetical protein